MEVPRLGVKSELQPPAFTTATAMWDPSCLCDLHHSSRQRQILDPPSKARVKPTSSWLLRWFFPPASQQELHTILWGVCSMSLRYLGLIFTFFTSFLSVSLCFVLMMFSHLINSLTLLCRCEFLAVEPLSWAIHFIAFFSSISYIYKLLQICFWFLDRSTILSFMVNSCLKVCIEPFIMRILCGSISVLLYVYVMSLLYVCACSFMFYD